VLIVTHQYTYPPGLSKEQAEAIGALLRRAVHDERDRCAKVCEAEAVRARELMTVTEADGRPLYDAKQLDAGACALEHVAMTIRGQP
jgi:hypothetical protein